MRFFALLRMTLRRALRNLLSGSHGVILSGVRAAKNPMPLTFAALQTQTKVDQYRDFGLVAQGSVRSSGKPRASDKADARE